MAGESYTLAEVRDTALRAVIRLELGECRTEGPRENILHLESWSSWNTTVNELTKDGFVLVTPAEYADIYGISGEEVDARIRKNGTLFALLYLSGPTVHCAVPLDKREPPEGLGPFPVA